MVSSSEILEGRNFRETNNSRSCLSERAGRFPRKCENECCRGPAIRAALRALRRGSRIAFGRITRPTFRPFAYGGHLIGHGRKPSCEYFAGTTRRSRRQKAHG